MDKEKKKISVFKVCMIMLCVLFVLLGTVVGAFFYMKVQGKKALQEEKVEVPVSAPEEVGVQIEEEGKYVVYQGTRYRYNENLINILCMGIDTSLQESDEEGIIGQNGQADALVLAVLDSATGELQLVNISRDSMVDVNKYNVKGQYLGTEKMQICLSFAYGDGAEGSCQNTIESVSRLMYGMPIHAYAAIDFESIALLNDAVGGVTVEVLEDLTRKYPELQVGATVTLQGEQAHCYVRSRNMELLESNNLRMARQKQYLMAFLKKALAATKEDINVPLNLYKVASDYMVTDIGPSEVTYLATLVLEHGISEGDLKSVPGEVVMGETYAEFIPDNEGLYELILDVFYDKVKE